MTTQKYILGSQTTCQERIHSHYESRMEDLRLLWAGYTNAECPKCDGMGYFQLPGNLSDDCKFCDGTGNLDENIPNLGSLFDYGLCFDYVPPKTFKDQLEGYFRYQLSWGGPQDEFRIFADKRGDYNWSIYGLEYWFLDWWDGAKLIINGDDLKFMINLLTSFFVEVGSFDHVYNESME